MSKGVFAWKGLLYYKWSLQDILAKLAPDDPDVVSAYFFLGNSYDNLWKPSKKGEAANDALLTKAVENYEVAAQKLSGSERPDYKKLGILSLQYLVAAYGADKLNDPGKAEPVRVFETKIEGDHLWVRAD